MKTIFKSSIQGRVTWTIMTKNLLTIYNFIIGAVILMFSSTELCASVSLII